MRTVVIQAPERDKSLVKLLDSMEDIRRQELAKGESESTQQNEYLILADRLRSELKPRLGVAEDFDKIVAILADKPHLMHYDVSSESMWRQVEPEISELLDRVLIEAMGDDFRGVADKQHVLNAAKCEMCANWPLKTRLEVYDYVRPVLDSSRTLNSITNVGEIIGNGTEILIKGIPRDLEEKIRQAGEMGFKYLILRADYYENRKDIKKMRGRKGWEIKGMGAQRSPDRSYTPRIMQRLYPLIGALPASLQRRVYINLEKKGITYDEMTPSMRNSAASIVTDMITAGGLMLLTQNPLVYVPVFGLIAVDYLRLLYSFGTSMFRNNIGRNLNKPMGSPVAKIVLFPIELILGGVYGKVAYNPLEIKIHLDQDGKEEQTAPNLHPIMEKLASSEDGASNFELAEKLKAQAPGTPILTSQSNKNDTFTLYNIVSDCSPFNKLSALVCLSGERYAITIIGTNEINLEQVSETLSDAKLPIEQRLCEIAERSGVRFAHLTHYSQGKKTEDMVAYSN